MNDCSCPRVKARHEPVLAVPSADKILQIDHSVGGKKFSDHLEMIRVFGSRKPMTLSSLAGMMNVDFLPLLRVFVTGRV